jgi:hypothetical protein
VLAALVVGALGLVLSGAAAAEQVVDDGDIGTDAADIGIDSVDAPDQIQIDENLEVEYTLVNNGDETGTETFVDLLVGGELKDWDEEVSVEPGGTATGTLVFESVSAEAEPGGSISFTVELPDSGDAVSGETDIADTDVPTPDLTVSSLEFPEKIGEPEDLTVEYTLTNVGDGEGTESFVDLIVEVDGLDKIMDTDENVTVPAGGSVSGTLVYENVNSSFELGDSVSFEVSLWDFDDNRTGETTVTGDLALSSVEYPEAIEIEETLEVTYTIANNGDVAATESSVVLAVGEDIENPMTADTHENVAVQAGETKSGTLVFDGIAEEFSAGDTFGFGVVLSDFGDQTIHEVELESNENSSADLQLTGIDAPDEVATDETLEVNYTIENTGNESGTESAVTLRVGNDTVDTDENVTVPADGAAAGTLAYDSVGDAFEDGDTLGFTVELSEAGDSTTGDVTVTNDSNTSNGADLQLASIEVPDAIATDETLEVNYTIENVGDQEGTETLVDLLVDGSLADRDNDVTVGAGETVSGTLVYDNVSQDYADGDTISLTVELASFGDSTSDTTEVGDSADPPDEPEVQLASVEIPNSIGTDENLTVNYTVENTADGDSLNESVTLTVDGEQVAEESLVVPAGGEVSGTLVDGGFENGTTQSVTVELTGSGDSKSGETSVGESQDPGEPDLQLLSIDAPEFVDPDGELSVSYTIENVGDANGTEGIVDLLLDGGSGFDSDFDVSVDAGETVSGTLTYGGDVLENGTTIEVTVELVEFGDSRTTSVQVGSPDQSGTIDVQETIATDTVSINIDVPSLDVVDDTGYLEVENVGNDFLPITEQVENGSVVVVPVADIGGVAVDDTIEVRLAPEDDFATVLDTATRTVEAGDNVPVALFQANPGFPEAGQEVTFDASSSRGEGSDIVSYRWDFTGDGEFDVVSETPTAQYSFPEGGVQEVRLVVENEVGLTDEVITEVPVQQPVAPPEPSLSSLDIDGQGSNATIETGAADLSVVLTNIGDEAGTFEVNLTIGDAVSESRTTDQLDGGGQQAVIFAGVTDALDPGTYDVSVSTAEGAVSGELTVEMPPDPDPDPDPDPQPAFDISILETNSPLAAGENLQVTVAVENTGDGDGTATVALDAGELGTDTTSVSLDSGESTSVNLSVTVGSDDAGEYDLTASAGDAESSATVTVEEDGGGSSALPVLLFLLVLVLLLIGGAYYYYVYEEGQSGGGMDPL